jgi:hypothetical protein
MFFDVNAVKKIAMLLQRFMLEGFPTIQVRMTFEVILKVVVPSLKLIACLFLAPASLEGLRLLVIR